MAAGSSNPAPLLSDAGAVVPADGAVLHGSRAALDAVLRDAESALCHRYADGADSGNGPVTGSTGTTPRQSPNVTRRAVFSVAAEGQLLGDIVLSAGRRRSGCSKSRSSLIEREPASSILSRFALPVIERHFTEYPRLIPRMVEPLAPEWLC